MNELPDAKNHGQQYSAGLLSSQFVGLRKSGVHRFAPPFELECKIGDELFGTVVGKTMSSPKPPNPNGWLLYIPAPNWLTSDLANQRSCAIALI